MGQLRYDEKFIRIIGEPVKYWQTINDIPQHIKDFVIKVPLVIYDNKKDIHYCSKCFSKLDNQNYCNKCLMKYEIPKSNNSKYIIQRDSNSQMCYYYVFDIIGENVVLYELSTTIYYPKEEYIKINKVYQIFDDGIENLITNEYSSYEECENESRYDELPYTNYKYLYTDNLEELRKTKIYKYTSIWELKDYFKYNDFTLKSLIINPVYYKQFEYLVKMGLYSLAVSEPNMVLCKKNFKEAFGIDKKYYQFMKEIDINAYQLEALKIYPTKDINLLNFISMDMYCTSYINNYVDLKKLYDYFEKQGLINENIFEYYDYLYNCEQLGFNLKDKNIIFPESLFDAHDKIMTEVMIVNNPDIDKKIGNLSEILNLNSYEDDDYLIFPATNIESLIDESRQQQNCVRTYCERVSNNDCQIYFMRKKEDANKSFVTIEVQDGKVVQARTKFNELPSDEIKEILNKWEKQIILVENYDY